MSKKLSQQDIKRMKTYCELFPKLIYVKVIPCDGTYTIRIKEFPNAITQVGPGLSELIEMISDCVATVLKIPKKYLPYMPKYLPSIELAQAINAFPRPKVVRQGKLSMVGGC